MIISRSIHVAAESVTSFYLKNNSIYSLLAVPGLRCYEGFSVVVVCRLLIAVASPVAECGLWGAWALVVEAHRFSSCGSGFSTCGSQALEHRFNSYGSCGLVASWHVGSSQIRDQTHVSCIGRFFTTEPPGKPYFILFFWLSTIPVCVYIYIYIYIYTHYLT